MAGMALPFLFIGLLGEPIIEFQPGGDVTVLNIHSGDIFVPILALGFAILSWSILFIFDMDEIDFLLGSILGPVIVFFGLVVIRAGLWQLINFYPDLGLQAPAAYWFNIIDFIVPDFGSLFGFVGSYSLAGFVAVLIHRRLEIHGILSLER